MIARALGSGLLVVWLVASTTTAHAECGWVLWIAPAKVRPFKWDAYRAYDTQAECEREGGDRQDIYNSEHPATPITTRCLPDTIDPRGAGGRR